jgi:hypothetical protein
MVASRRRRAGAAENAIILQNNQRAIIDDNKLFLVGRDGNRTLAKDGTHTTNDGGAATGSMV